VGEQGLAVGLDVSRVMVRIAAKRSGAPMLQADALHLPIAPGSMDLVYSAYLLDLIPGFAQQLLLAGVRRVLKPGGRLVILSLTEGVDAFSRGLVGLWKKVYALSPTLCAGCRPVRLGPLVRQAGFEIRRSQVVVQLGLPSQVVEAELGSAIRSGGASHAG
jgi:SAM-dependent methyltransferase